MESIPVSVIEDLISKENSKLMQNMNGDNRESTLDKLKGVSLVHVAIHRYLNGGDNEALYSEDKS